MPADLAPFRNSSPPLRPASHRKWGTWICSGCGLVFLADEVVELRVLLEIAGDQGADDVDLEVLVAGVFERGASEGGGDSSSAQGGWDFGVPEGHPSLVIAVEFEPSGFSVLFKFESAFGDFGGLGHFVEFIWEGLWLEVCGLDSPT